MSERSFQGERHPSRPARPSAIERASARLGFWRRAGDALARFGLVLTMLCLGVVVTVVVASTVWLMTDTELGNLTQSMSVFTVASPASWAVLAAGLAGAVVVVWVCWLAWHHGAVLDGRRAAVVLVVGSLAVQLVIILALQTRDSSWGDSWMVGDMTHRAAEGGVRSIFEGRYHTLFYDARLYFACYPFQAGFFWLLLGLRLVFGDLSWMALQAISALANALAVASVLDLGRTLTRSAGARRVLWVLVALCLPLYWLSTFLYLNALGFGLAAAFLAMQARSMQALLPARGLADGARRRDEQRSERSWADRTTLRSLAWCVGSLVPLALALAAKATCILFAFGALLAWVVLSVVHRRASGLVACACVVAVAYSLSALPFEALRAASGGYEFGDSLTTLNHLELGLREGQGEFYVSVDGGEETFAPGGWSNHANALWEASGKDAALQNAAAARLIARHLVNFTADPAYAVWFFTVKLATEWSDPTYQSLYYLSEGLGATGERVANPANLATPLGVGCTLLTFLLDGYQTVTFAAALGFVGRSWRRWPRGGAERNVTAASGEQLARASVLGAELSPGSLEVSPSDQTTSDDASLEHVDTERNPVTLLLCATFFVGFVCYLLWEAKAVYLLPFAIVILPLASAGLDRALSWGSRVHVRKDVPRKIGLS